MLKDFALFSLFFFQGKRVWWSKFDSSTYFVAYGDEKNLLWHPSPLETLWIIQWPNLETVFLMLNNKVYGIFLCTRVRNISLIECSVSESDETLNFKCFEFFFSLPKIRILCIMYMCIDYVYILYVRYMDSLYIYILLKRREYESWFFFCYSKKRSLLENRIATIVRIFFPPPLSLPLSLLYQN